MRRTLGALLCAVGAGILVYAGAAYARAAIERDRVRTAWEAMQARAAVVAARAALDRSVGARTLAHGAPIGRLEIPAIGLDEVVVEGVGEEELGAGPGHLPGSALPGEPGNAVISAHRDRHFHGLDALAVGDTLVTQTLAGRLTWVVVSRRVVEAAEPAIFTTSEPTLTLTTCWPVRYLGPAPDRLLITARLRGAARSAHG
jgi:LPXTG-site transpeptidase (sortase) family protein